MFLLLGGIFVSLQLVGLLLLSVPSKSYLEGNKSLEVVKPAKDNEVNEGYEDNEDNEGNKGNEGNECNEGSSDNKETGLTIKETIKRKDFWILWTIFMAVQLMQSFINSYQKAFGIKFINDDVYFSYVGLVSGILNGGSRIFWGKLYDWKGFKVS